MSTQGQADDRASLYLASLHALGPAIRAAKTREVVFQEGCQLLARTLGVAVRAWELGKEGPRPRASFSASAASDAFEIDGGALQHLLRSPGPVQARDACWILSRGMAGPVGLFALRPCEHPSGACLDFLEAFAAHVGHAVETLRVQEALEEKRRRLRTLIANLPEVVYRCSAERPWRFDFLSNGFEALTGYPVEDFLSGERDFDALPIPEDRERVAEVVEEGLRSGKPFRLDYRIRRKDGEIRWVRESGLLVHGPNDGQKFFEGVLLDVTEEKEAEAEQRRLLAAYQRAVRLRDEFLTVASHELKTPLTPIFIELQMLKRLLEDDPQLVKRVDRALRQTDRLLRLTDGLLDLSRISARQLQLELEVLDLGEVVGEVVELFQQEAVRRGSPIELEVEGEVLGLWDRLRLEQIIGNLLSNALKFGLGRPIQVRVRRSGDYARLEVNDRGIGIAPDRLDEIFERYAKAVAFQRYGGLGLGLFVTRRLAEAHGGKVWARNRSHGGTSFVLQLPIGPEAGVVADEAPLPAP